MKKSFKRLFVIPAKGQSSRIPSKNSRSFCGQPIIKRVLTELLKIVETGDKIHVSTDDTQIIQICNEIPLKLDFLRPESLCKDDVTLRDVRKYILSEYASNGYSFQTVIQVLPTSVLLAAEVLKKAIKCVEDSANIEAMLSISRYNTPIQWAYELGSDYSLSPREEMALQTPSQNLKTYYHETGDFVIYKNCSIAQKKQIKKVHGYLLPYPSVDIDNPNDWKLAERLFRGALNE